MISRFTTFITTQVILALLMEDLLVSAVNSPQMTFFTPPSHESTIHLESKYGYSATLKLARPKRFSTSVSASSSQFGRSDEPGSGSVGGNTWGKKLTEYVVLAPDYPFHGVTAVIQEMNLREGPGNQGCRDFVQFGLNSSVSTRTQEICGYISREDTWTNGTGGDLRRQRTFFNPDGAIHLYFYSDPVEDDDPTDLESSSAHFYTTSQGMNQEVGIEIVFTSYTVCPNPANSWKKLKACSTTDQMSCIYSTLFCDSKIDCGFPGHFGIDEVGCYYSYIYMTLSIVTTILITTVLIYLFVKWVTKVPKEYQ